LVLATISETPDPNTQPPSGGFSFLGDAFFEFYRDRFGAL
jgi:hypothetical protein